MPARTTETEARKGDAGSEGASGVGPSPGVSLDALRESELRFRQFAEATSEVLWIKDLQTGAIVYASPAFERIWGRSVESLLRGGFGGAGDVWRESLHPEDRERVIEEKTVWQRDPSRPRLVSEYRIVRPDGGVRWIRDVASRMGGGGPAGRVAGVAADITEGRESEERLRERDRLLRKIAEHVPGVIYQYQLSPDGRASFPYASDGIADIYGFRPDEVRQDVGALMSVIHPDDLEMVRRSVDVSKATLAPWRCEYRVLHPTRGERWLEGHSGPERLPDGSTLWHGYIRDITERKAAQESLHASSARLHQALQVASIGIFEHDHVTGAIYWSPQVRRIYGWAPDEPRTIDDLMAAVHPDDRQRAGEQVRRAHDPGGDGAFSLEHRLIRPDGVERFVVTKSQTTFEGAGSSRRPVRTIGAVNDLTERRLEQQKLFESQRALSSIVSNLPGFVYRCGNTPDWPFEYVSDQVESITGYTPDSLREGRPHYAELIIPEDVDRVWREVQEAVRERRPFTLLYRIRRSDGATRWMWEQGRAVTGPDGRVGTLEGFITDVTSQREASEAMQREQRLFLAGPVVALRWRIAEGWPVDFVTANIAQFGYSAEDFLSGRVVYADIIHPDDRNRVRAEVEAHREAGDLSFAQQYRIRTGGERGEYVWIQDFTVIVRDERGAPVHYEGYIFDDTRRRQAEFALAESQRRLALIVRRSPLGVIVWNPDFTVREWNLAAAAIFGYSEGDARGMHASRLVPPRLRPMVGSLFQQLLKERGGERSLNENVRRDGVSILCDWYNAPLVDDDGAVMGVVSMVEDVTDEAKTQAQIARREQDLRLIANALPALIAHVGADGKFRFVNEAFSRWFGAPTDSLRGRAPAEVLPEDFRSSAREHFAEVRAGRPARFEAMLTTIEGVRHVDVSLVPQTVAGQISGHYMLALDVSARKEAELELAQYREQLESLVVDRTAQLERQQRRLRQSEHLASLGTLAAGLGHDMNDMILPMRCALDALEPALTSTSAAQRVQLSSLRRSLEFLSQLSSGLLALASAPDDAQRGGARTNLSRWWARDGDMLASATPLKLRLSIPAGLPDAAIAPEQLSRAVLNLIVNAAEAGGPTGSAEIWARLQQSGTESTLVVGVTDDGPGMAPDVVSRAFEPFFTTKTRQLSTGLGLSLVHAVARSVGGSVSIDSNPGRGTTVSLLIPAAPDRPLANEKSVTRPTNRPGIARISLQDERIASLLSALLQIHQIPSERGPGPGDAAIWVVDGTTSPPSKGECSQIKKIIVVGSASPEWHALGAILIEDSADVAALNAAIRAP